MDSYWMSHSLNYYRLWNFARTDLLQASLAITQTGSYGVMVLLYLVYCTVMEAFDHLLWYGTGIKKPSSSLCPAAWNKKKVFLLFFIWEICKGKQKLPLLSKTRQLFPSFSYEFRERRKEENTTVSRIFMASLCVLLWLCESSSYCCGSGTFWLRAKRSTYKIVFFLGFAANCILLCMGWY